MAVDWDGGVDERGFGDLTRIGTGEDVDGEEEGFEAVSDGNGLEVDDVEGFGEVLISFSFLRNSDLIDIDFLGGAPDSMDLRGISLIISYPRRR